MRYRIQWTMLLALVSAAPLWGAEKETTKVPAGVQSIKLAPLGPGRVCLCGYFGKTWLAIATFDPKEGKKVKVFYEAREASQANVQKQWMRTTIAFEPMGMFTLTDDKGARRVLIGRSGKNEIVIRPLVVDPDALTVEVMRDTVSYSFLQRADSKGGAVYFVSHQLIGKQFSKTLHLVQIAFPGHERKFEFSSFPLGHCVLLNDEVHVFTSGGEWWLGSMATKEVRLLGAIPSGRYQYAARSSHYGVLACMQIPELRGDRLYHVVVAPKTKAETDVLPPKAKKIEPPPAGKVPRLALVSTEPYPKIINILTLAEAKLSTGAEVEILDRKTIHRLLAEKKLVLSGFVKSDQVLQAGKLLGVDLFAVLETDTDKAVALVVFDARTGVRLWDGSLPNADLDSTVTKVVESVRAASAKVRHQYKDLFTICVTTVRNVDLPRDQDAFCDTISVLLERGLVTSPTLVLLERTRLDQVNKERNLPTGAAYAPLLASLVRVELEVSREGKGLRGTALLFDSDGKPLGKPSVTVPTPDAVALAKALLPVLTGALKARPAEGVGDPLLEARRLAQESRFFRMHQYPLRGLRALEAANAL